MNHRMTLKIFDDQPALLYVPGITAAYCYTLDDLKAKLNVVSPATYPILWVVGEVTRKHHEMLMEVLGSLPWAMITESHQQPRKKGKIFVDMKLKAVQHQN